MGSSDSDPTEFPLSHPIEFFPFNISSLLEGFLEQWVGLFVEKKRIIMSWLGVCTIRCQGSSAGSGLTCSSGGAVGDPCRAEGWDSSQIPAWGVCSGKGWLGTSGEEMQQHFQLQGDALTLG